MASLSFGNLLNVFFGICLVFLGPVGSPYQDKANFKIWHTFIWVYVLLSWSILGVSKSFLGVSQAFVGPIGSPYHDKTNIHRPQRPKYGHKWFEYVSLGGAGRLL